MPAIDLKSALVAVCLTAPASCLAATHGLVVGISDYAAFEPYVEGQALGVAYDLTGARNDAERIASAMRNAGLDLPDTQILLDDEATLAAFLAAWDALLAKASPGDTLIITFAGHGAQERELSPPFDEADQRDEILMFHDFDPNVPGIGRLTDDALVAMFEAASDYDIVWVADSCHSGGLTRSVSRAMTRFGGLFDGLPAPDMTEVPLTEGDSAKDSADLDHVTQILATASEDLLVTEVEIDGKPHGALSWFFAQALEGQADNDQNGATSHAELAAFLDRRVFAQMNQSQQPRILPIARDKLFLTNSDAPVTQVAAPPAPQVDMRIPVTVLGPPPPGLSDDLVRYVSLGAALTFEQIEPDRWQVTNLTGDRVTEINLTGSADAFMLKYPTSAAPLVARVQALQALKSRITDAPFAPRVELQDGSGIAKLGSKATFLFTADLHVYPYLTAFNIASNGDVQYIHPVYGDGKRTSETFSIRFEVTEPVGTDQVFALFCPTPPQQLWHALTQADGATVTLDLATNPVLDRCEMAVTGLYTQR